MVAFACFGAANLSLQSYIRTSLLYHGPPYGQLALWVDVYPVLYGVQCLCNNVVINEVAVREGGVRHDGGGACGDPRAGSVVDHTSHVAGDAMKCQGSY